MRKILSIFAAMLVALAVNAQTDFAYPGYYCAADAGVIGGDAPANKVYLNSTADPHQIEWSDVSKTYTAVISWEFEAANACYITVGLDLGTMVSSNKHIFEVKLLDANNHELGALEEGPAYTGDGFTEAEQIKTLSGKLLIPASGNYKIELRNNRDYCKGSIRNIILTYAGVAPVTDFAAPGYSCTADDAVITGDAPANKVYLNSTADPHQIEWSDVSKSYTAAATWNFIATRGCYVSVALDLGTAVSSNKHIFDVELLDAEGNVLDTIAEGPNYTGDGFTESEQLKTLSGTILIPEAGNYTLKLMNHRDFCKGSIKNVILTYAADAPAPAEPVENGYYLVGTMNNWQVEAEYKLVLNEQADDTEYMYDITFAEEDRFKVVDYQNGNWTWHPGEGDGYVIDADHVGEATVYFRPNGKQGDESWYYTIIYVAMKEEPQPAEDIAVYSWADQIGKTILGGNSNIAIATVKIHTNTDEIPAIKFGSSYVYDDGKYLAIKPAEGGFKAGDVLSVAAVFSNSDDTKYAQVDIYAADTQTRLFRSDSASTINGRTSPADPIVQTYTLTADQESLLLGRYGNTTMFVTLLNVVRPAGEGGGTAIKFVSDDLKAIKRIENGQLVIIKNGVRYNVMGMQIR